MPYVITCDHCQARMRSPAKVPVGRTVKCPKCSNPVTVSTANQAEVSGSPTPPTKKDPVPARKPEQPTKTTRPVTAAVAPAKTKTATTSNDYEVVDEVEPKPSTARPKPTREKEIPQPRRAATAQQADSDEEFEEGKQNLPREKPREPARKSSNKLLLLLLIGAGGLGFMTLLAAGGIYYFLKDFVEDKAPLVLNGPPPPVPTNGEPTNPQAPPGEDGAAMTAKLLPSTRELPEDLLNYYPMQDYQVQYRYHPANVDAVVILKSKLTSQGIPERLGITPEQVENWLYFRTLQSNTAPHVYVVTLMQPFDLAAIAPTREFEAVPSSNNAPPLYRCVAQYRNKELVFQPKPNTIVVIERTYGELGDQEVTFARQLQARDLTVKQIPEGMRKLQKTASGFQDMTCNVVHREDNLGRVLAKHRIQATARYADHFESLRAYEFSSPADALRGKGFYDEADRVLTSGKSTPKDSTVTRSSWVDGSTWYEFQHFQLTPPAK